MLVMSLSATAFAVNTTGGKADITTSIAPTYTVTIPADVNVQFNATETAFGSDQKLRCAESFYRKAIAADTLIKHLGIFCRNGDLVGVRNGNRDYGVCFLGFRLCCKGGHTTRA